MEKSLSCNIKRSFYSRGHFNLRQVETCQGPNSVAAPRDQGFLVTSSQIFPSHLWQPFGSLGTCLNSEPSAQSLEWIFGNFQRSNFAFKQFYYSQMCSKCKGSLILMPFKSWLVATRHVTCLDLGWLVDYNFLHQSCSWKLNKQTNIEGKVISQALWLERNRFDFAHGAGWSEISSQESHLMQLSRVHIARWFNRRRQRTSWWVTFKWLKNTYA